MSKFNKRFAEYWEQQHKKRLYGDLITHIQQHTIYRLVGNESDYHLSYVNLDHFSVKDVFFENTREPVLMFSAIIVCCVSYEYSGSGFYDEQGYYHSGPAWSQKCVANSVWLKMIFVGSLYEGYHMHLEAVEDYSEVAYIVEKRRAGELVPFLSEEMLEHTAEEFLVKYCPQTLQDPMVVPVNGIINQMGLVVKTEKLPDNIFGQIYFSDVQVSFYDDDGFQNNRQVGQGTILLNTEFVNSRGQESVNFSFIHECVHWEKHRKYMYLLQLMDQSTSNYIECPNSLEEMRSLSWDFRRMEWQANNLAARILVPTSTAEKKFKQLLDEIKGEQPTWREAVVMEEAVKRLAKTYQVSNETAKYRVIQLGFEQAAGVLNYVDDGYAVPISFAKGSLEAGQTFIASDAVIERALKKTELSEAYEQQRIVHVQKMLVYNHSKYVVLNGDGHYELTDYALDHTDECCMVFETKRNSNWQRAYYSDDVVLNRDFMADEFKEVICDTRNKQNHAILENAAQGKVILEQLKEYMDIYKTLPSDFGGTLKKHRTRKGDEIKELIKKNESEYNKLTQEKLAERSILSPGSVGNYERSEKENVEFGTVLSLCVSLNLHPLFMIDLIKKAGYNLFNGSLVNAFYSYLVFYHHMESVEDWNLKLTQAGLSQLLPKNSMEALKRLEELLEEQEKWEQANKK